MDKVDFTSALYLGLRHASGALRPWAQLTSGVPQALRAPPGAEAVAQQLAALQGCERATLAPSTLHLFWDLCGMLDAAVIYVDAGVYPIARWGVERAAARGIAVRSFPHYDAGALRRQVETFRRNVSTDAEHHAPPIVVACGFCPGCGRHAPLPAYLAAVRALGGMLILDDTQALGIFGHAVGVSAPYGRGGGGSLRWHGIKGPDILLVSSLAKGFGVPMAVLAGSRETVGRFEAESETRVHCSPPSLAAIHAAERALSVNEAIGDVLRLRLARLVQRFRCGLAAAGLSANGGFFPVQTLSSVAGREAERLHAELLRRGISTVLHAGRNGHGTRISFIITAQHRPAEIDEAVAAIKGFTGLMPSAV